MRAGSIARWAGLSLGLAVLALAIVAPGTLASGDPLGVDPSSAFASPSAAHWFGTDESGRDVFTRVVHGAASSAGIGLAATALGGGLGVLLGLAAGVGPHWLDAAISRVVEVLFALPTMVMALLLIAVIGPGSTGAVIAIGLATAPGYARMFRARTRQVARSGYVEYARLEGAGTGRVLICHVLPNVFWPLVAVAALGIGQAIVWVAALGFLGLGALPPDPEWGAMINAGRVYLATAWWITFFPGLAIVATAALLTAAGRTLARDSKELP